MVGLIVAVTLPTEALVDQLLVHPFGTIPANQLYLLFARNDRRSVPQSLLAYADLIDLRDSSESTWDFAGFRGSNGTVMDPSPSRCVVAAVTNGYMTMLMLKPRLGRVLEQADFSRDSGNVVISHQFWIAHFGRDSSILGRTLRLDGKTRTVVGVLDPKAENIYWSVPDLWIPVDEDDPVTRNPAARTFFVIGRPRPEAKAEAIATAKAAFQIATLERSDEAGWTLDVVPFSDALAAPLRPYVQGVTAVIGLLLSIAVLSYCAVALDNARTHQVEISIRRMLGASRWSLIRLAVTRAAPTVLVGAAAGSVAGASAVLVVGKFGPATMPGIETLSVDVQHILITSLVIVGFALFSRVTIAVTATFDQIALNIGRSESARSRHPRWQLFATTSQLTAAILLLATSICSVAAVARRWPWNPGFRTSDLLEIRYALPPKQFETAGARRLAAAEMLQQARFAAGSRSAALSNLAPASGFSSGAIVSLAGLEESRRSVPAEYRSISDNYFDVLGTSIVSGRGFDASDGQGGIAQAIVNESLRRRLGAEKVLGAEIAYKAQSLQAVQEIRRARIVGVVSDFERIGTDDHTPTLYVPMQAFPTVMVTIVVRDARGKNLGNIIAGLVRSRFSELIPDRIELASDALLKPLAMSLFWTSFLTAICTCGFLIAAAGLGAVAAQDARARRPEFQIRMALGAQRRRVLALSMKPMTAAFASSVALAILVKLEIGHWLEVSFDLHFTTSILVAASVVMLSVTFLACSLACWGVIRRLEWRLLR